MGEKVKSHYIQCFHLNLWRINKNINTNRKNKVWAMKNGGEIKRTIIEELFKVDNIEKEIEDLLSENEKVINKKVIEKIENKKYNELEQKEILDFLKFQDARSMTIGRQVSDNIEISGKSETKWQQKCTIYQKIVESLLSSNMKLYISKKDIFPVIDTIVMTIPNLTELYYNPYSGDFNKKIERIRKLEKIIMPLSPILLIEIDIKEKNKEFNRISLDENKAIKKKEEYFELCKAHFYKTSVMVASNKNILKEFKIFYNINKT